MRLARRARSRITGGAAVGVGGGFRPHEGACAVGLLTLGGLVVGRRVRCALVGPSPRCASGWGRSGPGDTPRLAARCRPRASAGRSSWGRPSVILLRLSSPLGGLGGWWRGRGGRAGGRAGGWPPRGAPRGRRRWLGRARGGVVGGGVVCEARAWVPRLPLTSSFGSPASPPCSGARVRRRRARVPYAGRYFAGRRGRVRLLGLLVLFVGAMLGLVLADNLLVLYGFWELTSITSYLLIGNDHTSAQARAGGAAGPARHRRRRPGDAGRVRAARARRPAPTG